jgi:hypothetical protein
MIVFLFCRQVAGRYIKTGRRYNKPSKPHQESEAQKALFSSDEKWVKAKISKS